MVNVSDIINIPAVVINMMCSAVGGDPSSRQSAGGQGKKHRRKGKKHRRVPGEPAGADGADGR